MNKVLTSASRRNQKELAERLVKGARSIAQQTSVSSVKASLVQSLAQGVDRLACVLSDLERQLDEQLQNHPFGKWLLEQEGIGARTAGCFFGEAGDLDRFENDAQLARFAGNGAILNQSGQSEGRHRDEHRYNHRLKRAVLLMAESRYHHHTDSKKYVMTRKTKRGEYWKIIKKLVRHLIRFLWRGWQQIREKEPNFSAAT